MKHLSVEDKRILAQLYINGGCTMEQEKSWETLLLEDTEAMDLHIQLLSSVELSMPDMMDSIQFTDDVMNSIPFHLYEKEESRIEQQRRRWFEHPIFHYAVAACVTLLFLSTGLFDKLVTGDLTVIAKEQKQTTPYSEQMMDITVTWLDQLKR
ncbi:hypothetical protein [Paenibacillus macquariensis]|uniref:Anti-sigma factor n=1 Tax=Paenibacillus macquariensis TaxID=948756 RepID=A0ABY1JJ94_9BACL|nr:hypothetical protein [Paenibacillus macquariensis]MEC0089665.1 hypothetical protein [Paenibacillus macquariensis]OAB30852.1 hypothetical protein PMSM_22215 [Paenibacillus macquariensis subsp. macquariensis]SIQ28303.1 hypothetical protein SAMN05421578_10136 [Paenibacillus macquariensis]